MTARPWPSKLPIFDSTTSENRFSLGTTGRRPLICFGVNPSVATDLESDDTLRIVSNVARRSASHFDSWIMFNIYAQRSTDPQGMHAALDAELHRDNLEAIARLVDRRPVTVYAAWGTNIELRSYLGDALRGIVNLPELENAEWKHRGLTKKGHPRHPLGTKRLSGLQELDVPTYLSSL